MDQLLREFLADADDLIEAIFRDIAALRLKQGEGRARRELTRRIFRHVHTLKGTAAAAGLEVASQIAHEFETLLEAVRSGRVTLTEPVLDAFDDATQALSETLRLTTRGETMQLPLPLLENLRRLARSDDKQHHSHPASTAIQALLPEELARALSADDARRLHEARAEGQRLYVVDVAFDLETFDQRFRELSAALTERGELLSTVPCTTEGTPGAINFRLLYATEAGAEELHALASQFGSASIAELQLEAASDSRKAVGQQDESLASDSASVEIIAPLSTHVRVELKRLDELINAAHELMTETEAALELALESDVSQAEHTNFETRAISIRRRFVELEEQLGGLRRVTLAQTLERAARAGRQVARATGKEVAFEIEGADVRLDKSLVEALSDALLHLVRNAVDHGLESPAERIHARKNVQGTVRLEVRREGERVILRVTDDGRGIDLESIARVAVERGFIEADSNVSQQQALRLIFRPGFSTATVVSQVSGRGVGLDVVERAIAQAGGEIRVLSEKGQGTTFEMLVPITPA
jgi:two-component system, chemotaxis family, sensor kinase CheA